MTRSAGSRRARAYGLATLVGVAAMAGCGGGGSAVEEPTDGPSEVAQAFVRALADGDFGTAVELSTARSSDFACSWLVSDGRSGGIAAPEVAEATVDGLTATVPVTYTAGGEVTTTLTLTGGEGAWVVELPDTFQLEAAFTEPAVAVLRLDDAGIGADDCSVAAQDGVMTMAAFPGAYILSVGDPTGVMDYSLATNALVTGLARDIWDLGEPVPDWQLATLRVDVYGAAADGRVMCGTGLCGEGEGAVGPDGEVLPVTLVRVWTDDGDSWLAEFDIDGEGVTGTLERSDAGDLTVRLDSPA